MQHSRLALVEYSSKINGIFKETFKSRQRIKLTCFDVSASYIVFGATSGGVYIFKREPCKFVKLVPSKEGPINLISLSSNERHISLANSKGLLLIIHDFVEDSNLQPSIFSEHENNVITYMKWHGDDVYAGDNRGKVSVVSVPTSLFQAKKVFQVPAATLMTLDSSIVQIDAYKTYLLISTVTKTYLCDTEQENYSQIGTKLRDGYLGACFCNTLNDSSEITASERVRKEFHSMDKCDNISCPNTETKIFCARPGARLWQAGFDAKVLITCQVKCSLNIPPSEILVIGPEDTAVLEKRSFTNTEKIPDNFSFRTLYPIRDQFILTYDTNHLYIFDPESSKLIFWTVFSEKIKAIALTNERIYVWKDSMDIEVLSVVEVEQLILTTLYKKQYYLCAELCLEFAPTVLQLLEDSSKLYFISILKNKITCEELLKKLAPIMDKVQASNQKIMTRKPQPRNIVFVENLHSQLANSQEEEILISPEDEDTNKYFDTMLKQYKINKVHRTIDIPEVTKILDRNDGNELFSLLQNFSNYVGKELNEDATEWCQEQYLKHVCLCNIFVQDLTQESFDFLIEALFKANEMVRHSCTCGYPLPKSHKSFPQFYRVAHDVLKHTKQVENVLKNIPYMWRYRLKTEIFGLNLTALIQYSDLNLFKEHTLHLNYDNWHDILGYFVKLNKGLCLNCDRKLDLKGILSWTEVAKVIVQSLGSKNAIRILEKYEKSIPNGALDPTFYQTCIFAHTFDNGSVKTDAVFHYVEGLDKCAYKQFQETMAKYFRKKFVVTKNPYASYCINGPTGTCPICQLPLKNDILTEHETIKSCCHTYHKFCYESNGKRCIICE